MESACDVCYEFCEISQNPPCSNVICKGNHVLCDTCYVKYQNNTTCLFCNGDIVFVCSICESEFGVSLTGDNMCFDDACRSKHFTCNACFHKIFENDGLCVHCGGCKIYYMNIGMRNDGYRQCVSNKK